MREYKFRGMDINGNWYYGLLAHTENKKVCHDTGWFICNSEGSPFAYQIRPETIGEFTGLTDKNGKEIWEGDIMCFWDNDLKRVRSEKVYFENGAFCVNGRIGTKEWGKIIGNIYDNPELLQTNPKGD